MANNPNVVPLGGSVTVSGLSGTVVVTGLGGAVSGAAS